MSLNSEKEEFFKNSNLLITNKQVFELTEETISKFAAGKNKELKLEKDQYINDFLCFLEDLLNETYAFLKNNHNLMNIILSKNHNMNIS